VRGILQEVLITGKPRTDVMFERRFRFEDAGILIENVVNAEKTEQQFASMATGSDATSIYVANSNTFQESVLLPWNDFDEHIPTLNSARNVYFGIDLDLS